MPEATTARQADDWSADYRLFARDRWDAADLFAPVVRGTLHMLPENAPLVTALDDTRLPKSGRKIPGVGYDRDPMSPPFHINLVPGQRFVQLFAMVPAGSPPSRARGSAYDFENRSRANCDHAFSAWDASRSRAKSQVAGEE